MKNIVRIVNEAMPQIMESITSALPQLLELGGEILNQLITRNSNTFTKIDGKCWTNFK